MKLFLSLKTTTGENITESLLDIMINWKLSPNQLIVTTTDNGANFVVGFCGRLDVRILAALVTT